MPESSIHKYTPDVIIMTTCYGATQPVLSSTAQQYSSYNVAYRCRKQVNVQLATESIMQISVPDADLPH